MIGRSARVALPFVTVAAVLAVVAAACGPNPTVTHAPVSATGSLAPVTTAVGPPVSASPNSAVQVDEGLLAILPPDIGGVPLTFDPVTSATIAADPSLAPDATSIAVALAAATPPGASGATGADDFAIVSVIKLRDPARDEAWFRDWRTTYDKGACAQAAGLTRTAEAQLGGATVYIGSCNGGALTYHTRIEQAGIVVSVTAVGSRRLGEKVMAAIRR